MHFQKSLLRAKLAGRLEERERIARELHDTVLQSAHGLILKIQGVASQLPRKDPMRQNMEVALDQAGDLLGEARARLRDLRTLEPSIDISHAIHREGGQLSLNSSIEFQSIPKGASRPLRPGIACEIVAIAREALVNAFRHSEANAIKAEIFFERTCLVVRVSDNGRGYHLSTANQREQGLHFGIQGMRERARLIGARLIMSSCSGVGTEIECTLPAALAYAVTRSARECRANVVGRYSSGDSDSAASKLAERATARA